MKSTTLPVSLLLLILVAPPIQAESGVLPELDGRIDTGNELIIGGQPEPHELVEARQSGIRHLVNLRGEGEFTDWDQARLADQLDFETHRIPIGSEDDLDLAAVEKFDRIVKEIGDEPALMHCASGNRVGALFALREAWIKGADPETAIETGRDHGLTGLEDRVRQLIEDKPGA